MSFLWRLLIFSGVSRRIANPRSLPSSKACQKSGAFPPPGVARLRRYHAPVRLPLGPPSPGVQVANLAARLSHVARMPSGRAVSTTPADLTSAFVGCFLVSASFPLVYGGSASALTLSRPAQSSLALRPVRSLDRRHAEGVPPARRGLCHKASARPVAQPSRLSATGANHSPGGTFLHWSSAPSWRT